VGGSFRRAVASTAGIAASAIRLANVTDVATRVTTAVGADDPVNRAARLLQPSTGVNVTTVIDLLSALEANGTNTSSGAAAASPAAVAALASTVLVQLRSGSLGPSVVQALATSLGVSPSAITAVVALSSITESTATSTVSTGGAMSTAGGEPFYIGGIMSISTVDPTDIKILIGGRLCANLSKTVDGDLAAQYGVPPDSPLAPQYKTFRLDCLTPPGAGKDLPIVVVVPGGQSQANPDFVFSYAPPTITDVVDPASVLRTSDLLPHPGHPRRPRQRHSHARVRG
jgi:hypothetical protein